MSDWKNVQYKEGKMRTSEGGGGGSSTFAGLDDVNFSNLADGQIPKYDSQTQKWVNANESGGGGTVTDVQVDSQSVVDANGVAQIPAIPSDLDDLSDVDLTGLSDGDILAYQQSIGKFKPSSAPSGGGNVDDVYVNGTSVVDANKIAQIVSYKEVTQAQYNALPASKESDGVLYCIKDAPSGTEGFPPLIYSDEEREVGVWRNGKPLYQKTISFSISGGTNTTSLGVTNMDMCLMICAFKVDGTFSTFIPFIDIEAGGSIDSWSAIVYRVNLSSGDINYRAASRFAGQTIYATFQYTKTSDIAGSGQWSTSGIPTHHYSTSEHVIGTWIDGKPLYEKTIELNSYIVLPTKSWATITSIQDLSISKLASCKLLDQEGCHWTGCLTRINNNDLQGYAFEGWTVKTVTIQYTKTTD